MRYEVIREKLRERFDSPLAPYYGFKYFGKVMMEYPIVGPMALTIYQSMWMAIPIAIPVIYLMYLGSG
jgi:hypothetical protein